MGSHRPRRCSSLLSSLPGRRASREPACRGRRCANGSGCITSVRISGPRTRRGRSALRLRARAIAGSSSAAPQRTSHGHTASLYRAQASTSKPAAISRRTATPIASRRRCMRKNFTTGARPAAGRLPLCLGMLRSEVTWRACKAEVPQQGTEGDHQQEKDSGPHPGGVPWMAAPRNAQRSSTGPAATLAAAALVVVAVHHALTFGSVLHGDGTSRAIPGTDAAPERSVIPPWRSRAVS